MGMGPVSIKHLVKVVICLFVVLPLHLESAYQDPVLDCPCILPQMQLPGKALFSLQLEVVAQTEVCIVAPFL
jgi:hypothetical protein